MNASRTLSLALTIALVITAAPAMAGPMLFRVAAGQSVSEAGHGSTFEAALLARLEPSLAIGVETGVGYMRLRSQPPWVEGRDMSADFAAGLTDGLTRNSGFFLGPVVHIGTSLYAVASVGVCEFAGDDRAPSRALDSQSVGLGLTGTGRIEPTAEIRVRHAGHRYGRNATAASFTFGVHFH